MIHSGQNTTQNTITDVDGPSSPNVAILCLQKVITKNLAKRPIPQNPLPPSRIHGTPSRTLLTSPNRTTVYIWMLTGT
jgi:hypothetical protein